MSTAYSAQPGANHGLSLQWWQSFSDFRTPAMPTELLASMKIDASHKPSCLSP